MYSKLIALDTSTSNCNCKEIINIKRLLIEYNFHSARLLKHKVIALFPATKALCK